MIAPITTGGVNGWEMALGGGGFAAQAPLGAAKGAPETSKIPGVSGANEGEQGSTPTSDGSGGIQLKNRFDRNECQTCKNRTYQDESNDPGVSMKTPTKLSPAAAGAAVAGHEQEHVTRNKAKAESEGREVISSSVQIHTGVCPECGKVFVSGGTTRTVTADKKDADGNNNSQDKGASPAEKIQ